MRQRAMNLCSDTEVLGHSRRFHSNKERQGPGSATALAFGANVAVRLIDAYF